MEKTSLEDAYSINNNQQQHLQRRMSWFPQRWRTQRNAIRHANCRIQWVIKTLNATCTALPAVCLLECLFIPYPSSWDELAGHFTAASFNVSMHPLIVLRFGKYAWRQLLFAGNGAYIQSVKTLKSVRTSNQSRLPAEFKHITKRRKRN